jgi:hypothetical protein
MAGPRRRGSESYFSEMRSGNSDPNFFNRIELPALRRNVKRIIKDIRFNIIDDMDYIYFTNSKVLRACIEESAEQCNVARTIHNALLVYSNSFLRFGMGPYPYADIRNEKEMVARIQPEYSMRWGSWSTIYDAFNFIDQNNIKDIAAIKAALSKIQLLPPEFINRL